MLPRNRIEWLTVIGGMITIIIVLVYCGWRIQITQEWLEEHRNYVRTRDQRWDPLIRELQDHLTRQDSDYQKTKDNQIEILSNLAEILDHTRREESAWKAAHP